MSTVLERNDKLIDEKPGHTGCHGRADVLEDEAGEGIRPVMENIAKVVESCAC